MTHTLAGQRTRCIKKIIDSAGYTAQVSSTPSSHRAQATILHRPSDPEAIAEYLSGYLESRAKVSNRGDFVSIHWLIDSLPPC